MRTARSNQSDFKIKSIQLQNPINPNTKWISGKLQNSSSEGPVRHLLPAAKTEGEQNAVRAWRKGKDLIFFFKKIQKLENKMKTSILEYYSIWIQQFLHKCTFDDFSCSSDAGERWAGSEVSFFPQKVSDSKDTKKSIIDCYRNVAPNF